MKSSAPAFIAALLLSTTVCCAQRVTANWPAFRGSDATGVAYGETLPIRWDATKNVNWKRDIPGRGWSSPIVWNGQIILTTVETEGKYEEPKKGLYFGGERAAPPQGTHHWKVMSLDLKTGEPKWEQKVHSGQPDGSIHIKNSFASETPITDGERIYAYFGNLGLFCLDMNGKPLWQKRFKAVKTRLGWGPAASPALHDGRLYVVNDNEEGSWLLALDAKTGDEIWKLDRKGEKSNWSTPFVWVNEKRTEIITPGSGQTRAYSTDGKLLYQFGGLSVITIATPYADSGLLYVSSGYVMDARRPIMAIRPGASGDISLGKEEKSNEHIAWCQKKAAPYNPSTLVYDGLLYVLHDRGFVACYDAKTGEEVYGKKRLPNAGGFTASPWAYNGHVFFINENGRTFVLKAGREFKLVGTNDLADGDMGMATPAVAGGNLLIRTKSRLYSLSNK